MAGEAGKGYNPNTVNHKTFTKRMDEIYNVKGHKHVFSKSTGFCLHCGILKDNIKESNNETESTTK